MIRKRLSLYSLMTVILLALLVAIVPSLAQSTTQPMDAATVYETVSPSVVAINVIKTASQEQTQFALPEGRQAPFEMPPQVGGGSGFVIDSEGHIVTNYHVVEGATRIEVAFYDGTKARAEIVGLDPDSDLAVIDAQLDGYTYQPVQWGDSDALVVGEPVLAIGSPFGQRWTLTSGIISALNRTIEGLSELGFSIGGVIQTDAAINPGNSGGPLLNMRGEVIGVNSQIQTRSGGNDGIGYAIPSDLTQRVAQELITQGFVQYPYLGIRGGDVSLSIIEALNLPNDAEGVVVSEATSGGPAARAGLQSAGDYMEVDGFDVPQRLDIITAINGVEIKGINDLIGYLARETRAGDEVTLTVLRNGTEQIELAVNLMPRP